MLPRTTRWRACRRRGAGSDGRTVTSASGCRPVRDRRAQRASPRSAYDVSAMKLRLSAIGLGRDGLPLAADDADRTVVGEPPEVGVGDDRPGGLVFRIVGRRLSRCASSFSRSMFSSSVSSSSSNSRRSRTERGVAKNRATSARRSSDGVATAVLPGRDRRRAHAQGGAQHLLMTGAPKWSARSSRSRLDIGVGDNIGTPPSAQFSALQRRSGEGSISRKYRPSTNATTSACTCYGTALT